MTFRSICFQVVKTEPFKHFFCSYFKVIHDFIKCRSTFIRSGIISIVCKVRTIVFKKQITKIYVKQQRPGWVPRVFKVGLSPSKKNCFICFNKSPSKVMKNAFYFILKALLVLKIFIFSSWRLVHLEKIAWKER